MCWGAGILLSSGVVRGVSTLSGDIAWRLPFALQWIWPVPLFIAAYVAPESPWNCVRRNKPELAKKSLYRILPNTPDKEQRVATTLAYIEYTTRLEKAEGSESRFIDCFRGTNARRTEIVCI
jgi:SP family general alpha glucoside:H+ symporter-like MFS transporter